MSDKTDVSQAQEEKLAKLLKANRTPRSGGGAWKKGDLHRDNGYCSWLIEAKATVKPSLSYSANKTVLDKMDHERAEMHKDYAALAIELGESREDFFVINKRTMLSILDTQDGIVALIKSLEAQVAELDKKYEELRYGVDGISPEQKALHSAHKQEKLATIDELRKLL
ncbi:MAG: hypothetical protein NC218_02295 [Acetobacter sp.]|nr:hypothetical protein [Acetobacter sp.]